MTTASLVNAGLSFFVLSLTPVQRWQAARSLNIGFMGERWFIAACLAVLVILTVLFIIVTHNRSKEERKVENRMFYEYADQRGLNPRERHILMYIATRANLKQKESIFTMADAFDRGATKIIRASMTLKGRNKRSNLSAELSVLREKLGFRRRVSGSVDTLITDRPSSRQIPAGGKLYITTLETGDLNNIESVVIENNDLELTIETKKPLEIKEGELLCLRYYFGASIWEFETTVVGCVNEHLTLNHSNNVRFVNRRRFLRVAINEPAYIAAFPFAKTLPGNEKTKNKSDSDNAWGPPSFVPADVTELAGPGLRVVAPLKVKVGDRVVVILKLDQRKNHNMVSQADSKKLASAFADNGRIKPSRIIEDIGVVRHSEAAQDGYSIAVELTGLNDANLSELVRVTNAASLKARFNTQPISDQEDKKKKRDNVPEAVVV